MIGGEHDPVDAHFEQKRKKGGCEVESAECIVKILAQVAADRLLKAGHAWSHVVDAPDHERKRLAQMTKDELQFREADRHAVEHQAGELQQHARGKGIAVHLAEGAQPVGPNLVGLVSAAVKLPPCAVIRAA